MTQSRPLVPAAILLMMGIVAGRFSQLNPSLGLLVLAAGAILLFFQKIRRFAGVLMIVMLGATLYSARYRTVSPDDSRLVFSSHAELTTVRGKLVETPAAREILSGSNHLFYARATIDLTEILRDKEWRPIRGRLATVTRGELAEDFFQGRVVEVTGVIDRPPKAAAPGLFDYRNYLWNLRVFHQLRSDSTNDWLLLTTNPMPVTEQFRRWAQVQLGRGLPPNDARVEMIWATTLGLRSALDEELNETFIRTGTMHIVAISGLHVACISYLLYLIFVRGFGLSRPTGGIIVLLFVWFYTLSTGLQSSAIRSAVMATVFISRWLVRRPSDLLNTVAASAVLILLAQPEQLFQASFQLSFSVVTVIALTVWLSETCYPEARVQFRHQLLRIDPFLPHDLIPKWKLQLGRVLALLGANGLVALASWVGSLPLTAYYFNTVTPIGLIANLLAVPLSSIALAASAISLLVPPLAPLSNQIALAFTGWTIEVADIFAKVPFGYFYVPRPNLFFFLFYFATVALLLIPPLRSLSARRYSVAAVVAFGVVWVGSVLLLNPSARITVLPCAGTPALVSARGQPNLLIDCSSAREANYMVKRFLRAQGRGSLDCLLLTHGDAQNVGGFPVIWSEFKPELVFTSGVRARSPGYRKAIETLDSHPDRWMKVACGSRVNDWELLHPPSGRGMPKADDNCVVLKGEWEGIRVLHLSDLGKAGQQQLLESGSDLRSDIVIAGMPEAGEPLHPELLEAISPRVILLGTSRFPYTALGTTELRARLEKAAAVFYSTESDAVTLTFRDRSCRIQDMNGRVKIIR